MSTNVLEKRGLLHWGAPRPERKHRIHDYVERLEKNLRNSQELAETLSHNLSAQIAETTAAQTECAQLRDRVAELEERLRVAQSANQANANRVDFRFAPRPIDGPEDQPTMPVPQAELLDTGSIKVAAVDAATALLERVVPKTSAPASHKTPRVWNAKPSQQKTSVVWGRPAPQTLMTDQSTTGTYRVLPLHEARKGSASPTVIPGTW